VRVRTINDIVSAQFGGRWPDLLSLDTPGSNLSVLASADFGGAGPRVIVVKATSDDPSAESEGLSELLASLGYAVLGRTPGNLIAVRGDAVQSVSQLARPARTSPGAKLDLVWTERSASRWPDGTRPQEVPAMAKAACRASYTVRMSLGRCSVVGDLFSYAHY